MTNFDPNSPPRLGQELTQLSLVKVGRCLEEVRQSLSTALPVASLLEVAELAEAVRKDAAALRQAALEAAQAVSPFVSVEDAHICKGYLSGLSDDEVGRNIGRHPLLVGARRGTLRLAGRLQRPPRGGCRWTPEELEEVVTAYGAGDPVSQIACRLGRSHGSISSVLEREGLLDQPRLQVQW
jgi:hypothetical protein